MTKKNLKCFIKENFKITTNKNILIQSIVNITDNTVEAFERNNIKIDEWFVFVKAYYEESSCVISIKDNAGGIGEQIIDKIFEPYFTTKHKMTYQVINQQLNGTIESHNVSYKYKNNIYKGSEFISKFNCFNNMV